MTGQSPRELLESSQAHTVQPGEDGLTVDEMEERARLLAVQAIAAALIALNEKVEMLIRVQQRRS